MNFLIIIACFPYIKYNNHLDLFHPVYCFLMFMTGQLDLILGLKITLNFARANHAHVECGGRS